MGQRSSSYCGCNPLTDVDAARKMNATARGVALKQRAEGESTQIEGAEGDDTAVRRRRSRGSLFRPSSEEKWQQNSIEQLQASMQAQMVFLTQNAGDESAESHSDLELDSPKKYTISISR